MLLERALTRAGVAVPGAHRGKVVVDVELSSCFLQEVSKQP